MGTIEGRRHARAHAIFLIVLEQFFYESVHWFSGKINLGKFDSQRRAKSVIGWIILILLLDIGIMICRSS